MPRRLKILSNCGNFFWFRTDGLHITQLSIWVDTLQHSFRSLDHKGQGIAIIEMSMIHAPSQSIAKESRSDSFFNPMTLSVRLLMSC